MLLRKLTNQVRSMAGSQGYSGKSIEIYGSAQIWMMYWGGGAASKMEIRSKRSFDKSVSDVVDAVDDAHLYGRRDPPVCTSIIPNGSDGNLMSHLIVLDTSAGEVFSRTFDVRASIDISAAWTDEKVLQGLKCKLESEGSLEELQSIQKTMPSRDMLKDWCGTLQGAIYSGTGTGASGHSDTILQEILSSMKVVAGGQNYLLDTSESQHT